MQIFWNGYSSIRIETKSNNETFVITTDPFENESAIRFSKAVQPDMLLLSHQDRSRFNLDAVSGNPFIISNPGEYEVGGVFVHGIQDKTVDSGLKRPLIYKIDIEDMTVAFLGGINREITSNEIDALGNVDVLILPVGGGDVLGAKTAFKFISLIEPRLIIPINYYIPGIKAKLEPVDMFCNLAATCKREDASKIKISKKDLPSSEMVIKVLERS